MGDGKGAPGAAANTLLSLPRWAKHGRHQRWQDVSPYPARPPPRGGAAGQAHRHHEGHGGAAADHHGGDAWDLRRMAGFEVADRASEGLAVDMDPHPSSIHLQPAAWALVSVGRCPPPLR